MGTAGTLGKGVMLMLGMCAVAHAAAVIDNLTGLPAYPNLTAAAMDPNFHTEALGRWCARFTGTTSDSLASVEAWYRKTLRRPSETNLSDDRLFAFAAPLPGIKLALGLDYVAVYRVDQRTVIELHRCSWN